MNSEPFIDKNGTPASVATALAKSVLPPKCNEFHTVRKLCEYKRLLVNNTHILEGLGVELLSVPEKPNNNLSHIVNNIWSQVIQNQLTLAPSFL